MKIAGYDYLAEQNNRIRNQLQDFSTNTKPAESVVPVNPSSVPSSDTQQTSKPAAEEPGVTLSISANGGAVSRLAARLQELPTATTPSDFASQGSGQSNQASATSGQSGNTGNSVLNQYRFFVQSTQYEDNDGVVKRIFR